MRDKHTTAELRMARLFIVVVSTKGPSIPGAYVQPDLCQWRIEARLFLWTEYWQIGSTCHIKSYKIFGSNLRTQQGQGHPTCARIQLSQGCTLQTTSDYLRKFLNT